MESNAAEIDVVDLQGEVVRVHNAYLQLRHSSVPFPWTSALFWCLLFGIQRLTNVRGNLLELGVKDGGSAFLSIQAMRAAERHVLVDLVRTPVFASHASDLAGDTLSRLDFLECPTSSDETKWIRSKKYRWIHIDAGHKKHEVLEDIENYWNCLQDDGILVFDDFLTARWPEVTEAILEGMPRTELIPFGIVDRKLYVARGEYARKVGSIMSSSLSALRAICGVHRLDTRLLGVKISLIQLKLGKRHVGLPLQTSTASLSDTR